MNMSANNHWERQGISERKSIKDGLSERGGMHVFKVGLGKRKVLGAGQEGR